MSIIINKVTTKTGDKGLTLGPGCKQILKNSNEIDFLGNIDELNAFIGESYQYLENNEKELMKKIQNDLFDIGANFYKQIDIKKEYVAFLDDIILNYQENLSPLSSFLIPMGSDKIVKLHIIRAISRRVERSFYKIKYIDFPNIGVYFNRLSDIFFILLRDTAKETLWSK